MDAPCSKPALPASPVSMDWNGTPASGSQSWLKWKFPSNRPRRTHPTRTHHPWIHPSSHPPGLPPLTHPFPMAPWNYLRAAVCKSSHPIPFSYFLPAESLFAPTLPTQSQIRHGKILGHLSSISANLQTPPTTLVTHQRAFSSPSDGTCAVSGSSLSGTTAWIPVRCSIAKRLDREWPCTSRIANPGGDGRRVLSNAPLQPVLSSRGLVV